MYAVTIEPLNSMIFLADRPDTEHGEVLEDVQLDLPPLDLFLLWPEGMDRPESVLCRSTSDEKHFKVFKNPKDIEPSGFQPTGKTFGGFFSKASWDRFVEQLPAHLKFLAIPDNDPPGAWEEAYRNILRAC